MCGIAGYIGEKYENNVQKMLSMMEHRGRDGRAQYEYKTIHIGMNRLAINDLAENIFPIHYKHFTLVYNGEIYNYKALKNDLEKLGVHFKTSCDAEVILPLFHLYGNAAFLKIEGMFALCIVDRKQQTVFLVRDKFGEKPLYVLQRADVFIFASEIKALIGYVVSRNKFNIASLGEYFTQGFIGNGKTLVGEIYKVQPSQILQFPIRTKVKYAHAYWHMPSRAPIHHQDEIQAIHTLESLIESSVRHRLLSDVPVGSLLSGGIDSSIITLHASRRIRNLRTFSISYPSSPQDDESMYAKKVAQWLGTDHFEIPCTALDVQGVIRSIGSIADEPVVDPAMLPTYVVANQARKHVKVVLTGIGADEIFAGYDRYAGFMGQHRYRNFILGLPIVKHIRDAILPGGKDVKTHLQHIAYLPQNIWTPHELAMLLRSPQKIILPPPVSYTDNKLSAMQSADMRGYLACQVLMMVDKMAMANNLEARAPFLDTAIVEFAATLPESMLIRGNQTKYILRKVAQKYFPEWFARRPKHGFSVPLRDWFNDQLHPEVVTMVDQACAYQQLFNISFIQETVREHENHSQDNSEKIWSLIVLCSWLIYHKMRV